MGVQRALATFTVATLLVTPTPARQAAAPQLELPYEAFTLSNGLHVILHEDHTVPKVSVNGLCLAGDGNRSKELGLYNFLGYDITHAWPTSARDRRATNATS